MRRLISGQSNRNIYPSCKSISAFKYKRPLALIRTINLSLIPCLLQSTHETDFVLLCRFRFAIAGKGSRSERASYTLFVWACVIYKLYFFSQQIIFFLHQISQQYLTVPYQSNKPKQTWRWSPATCAYKATRLIRRLLAYYWSYSTTTPA